MEKTIVTLKDILIPLCLEPPRARSILSPQALKTYLTISEKLEPITVQDITNLFRHPRTRSETHEVNFSQSGKVLYLPPLEKDDYFVPILSLRCKLSETQSIAQFRVLLTYLEENQTTNEIYGIGFRMEAPDSINQNPNTTTNNGIHDFYHAQLIQKLDRKLRNKLQIKGHNRLPDSQPSFPLPADCPVTLLLCMIVTLYGRIYYNRFLTQHKKHMPYIKQYQKKLHQWINRNEH